MGHLMSTYENRVLPVLCPVIYQVILLTLSRKEELVHGSVKNRKFSERTSSGKADDAGTTC